VFGDEALDLVDAGSQIEGDPHDLTGTECRSLGLESVTITRVTGSAVVPVTLLDLDLESVHLLSPVAHDDRDRPGPDLFGLERDRELAESELETVPARIHMPGPAERRRLRRGGRAGSA